ncbi:unnamed protein product [Camellia sinensis]
MGMQLNKTFPNKWSIIGGAKKEKKKATDAPYSKWQCQIMYYWYKKVKAMPGSDMGGFTRVLHSGNPDNLMEEIPTFVVDPFPDGLDWVEKSPKPVASCTMPTLPVGVFRKKGTKLYEASLKDEKRLHQWLHC